MSYLNLGDDRSSNKHQDHTRRDNGYSAFRSDLGEFVRDLAEGAAIGVGAGAFALVFSSWVAGTVEGRQKAQQKLGVVVHDAYDMTAASDFALDHWKLFLATGAAGGIIAGYQLNKKK